ncbi:MAG: GTPase family protein [Tissierella sp.]|uniref:GTPase family protein n=1 Tax=Tissierella sp. TaxID=41274 RepID=UPI003F9E4E5C
MAIDKNKTKKLIDDIDELFETVSKPLPKEAKRFIQQKVMDPIFDEVNKLILESRPPVIFLVGRSGHGKSSLLNALANREVSEVGDIKPTTAESISYEINFEDRYASWSIVDTRGIFETTAPNGALGEDAVEILKRDIIKYKPDIILHVVAASEIRNLSNDLKVFKDIKNNLRKETGVSVPTIVALNKVDTLGNPRNWPPEENTQKSNLIREALDYMTRDILHAREIQKIDLNKSIKGYKIFDDEYKAIVPICSLKGDLWNIETLSDSIGSHLPDEAIIDFYQAQKRKDQLKRLSTSIINKFSTISGTIGASPIPISDIFVLTPLQLLMISIIGGLSCREFKKETSYEYLTAAGINIGAAFGLRTVAHQFMKIIPIVGWAGSGAIAASGTYAIGKSAEAYFFLGEIKKPEIEK